MSFHKIGRKIDDLLTSPIYNLKYHKRKQSQEEQTSATGSVSEYSINPKKIKNFPKNRVIPSLNIPVNLTTFATSKSRNRNRVISNPSLLDSLPNISQKSIEEKDKNKNKNKKNLFLTYHVSREQALENKIKKIFFKHKFLKKKNNALSPSLTLIKETDLTKKRYYFGFMTEISNNSNNNSNNESKKDYSLKNSSIKKKISIISKSEGLKKRIEELLSKPHKKLLLKSNKIKLGPLKFNKHIKNNIKVKNNSLDNLIPIKKKSSIQHNKLKSQDFQIALDNLTNNLKTKEKNNENNVNNNIDNNTMNNNSNILKLSTISVKFKKSNLNSNNNLNKKENQKLNVRFLSPKKSKILDSKTISPNKQKKLLQEESTNEHEDSNIETDSLEEIKKKRLKEKEKRKYRARLSSSTLISAKQLIKFYEYFHLTEQEKKFLVKLHNKKLILKKVVPNNYTELLQRVKKYLEKKTFVPEKNNIKDFNYNSKMFLQEKEGIYEFQYEFEYQNIDNFIIKSFKDGGLNYITSHHLMNLYMPMSPQIIVNCISAPEKTLTDLSFLDERNCVKRKTCDPNIVNQLLNITFSDDAEPNENVFFYQKFIHIDNGTGGLCKGLITGNESDENDNESKFNKTKKEVRKKTKKKRKINLNILKKKKFFKMENKERHFKMDSILEKFINNSDEIVKQLVDQIEVMREPQFKEKRSSIIFFLLEICIKKQSYDLFIRFYHRYHNFFNINSIIEKNSGNNLLIIATKENAQSIGKYLISKGIDLNYRNYFGNTAMHFAISYKNYQFADLLKRSGAREDIENGKGLIPWECINHTCE